MTALGQIKVFPLRQALSHRLHMRRVHGVVAGADHQGGRVDLIEIREPVPAHEPAAAQTQGQCYADHNTKNVPLRRPTVSETHRITVDPDQCGGRPCLRGLRIRVRDVLDLLAAGADHAEILADNPLLQEGDIIAALEYAARQSDHPVLRMV